MPNLVQQAKARLLELNNFFNVELMKAKEAVEVDRLAWVRHERRVKVLIENLRNTRKNIIAVLSAATLYVASLINVLFNLLLTQSLVTKSVTSEHKNTMLTLQDIWHFYTYFPALKETLPSFDIDQY